MRKCFAQAAIILAAISTTLFLLMLGMRAREPVYQGKRASSWIAQMRGIAVKVVEGPGVTYVFLANLSDEEVLALNDWNPKVRFVPGNAAMACISYPNNGARNGEGTDCCGF